MAMVQPEVVTIPRPRPPAERGAERKRGSQVKRPHQPKRVAAFMVAQMRVLVPRRPRKSWAGRKVGARCCRQASGSWRLCWIQSAMRAGAMPARKTARHP